MEKYCTSCGRVFKDVDFKFCPYCQNQLSVRVGRQNIPRQLRHQVFQRDGYRCRECGATNKETRLHIDHIKPVSKGGTNHIDNLQTLCEACNLAKYTDEWVGGNTDLDLINLELDNIGDEIEKITNKMALAETDEERMKLDGEIGKLLEKIDQMENLVETYDKQEKEKLFNRFYHSLKN